MNSGGMSLVETLAQTFSQLLYVWRAQDQLVRARNHYNIHITLDEVAPAGVWRNVTE